MGSGKGHPDTLGSSKYKFYFPHLLNELFPKIIGDLEGVKNDWFPPMYLDFYVWKKVGNSYSTV